MDRMIYTAMTGASAAQHRQQVLSNNLANASTPGFRAELSTFRAVPVRGEPGSGSFGSIRSGALEDSNVDLTAELVNMMTAQRAYQANAQTIKTQDQVLSTLLNMR